MPQTPHVERHFTSSEKIRDIVIGMSDGLTVLFALPAGMRRVQALLVAPDARVCTPPTTLIVIAGRMAWLSPFCLNGSAGSIQFEADSCW